MSDDQNADVPPNHLSIDPRSPFYDEEVLLRDVGITEKFTEAGGFVARSVGMPDVPRVQLPHPVAGTGEARIAEIARLVAPAIVASWQTRVARAA